MLNFIFLAGHKVIFLKDWVLMPIVLVILYLIAYKVRKRYTSLIPEARRYFIPGLHVRMIGCFASACMYHFYYAGGDSTGYFLGVGTMFNLLLKDPVLGMEMLFSSPENYSYAVGNYIREARGFYYMDAPDTMLVIKMGAVLALFTFKSYLAIGFIMAFFAFLGCWKIYEVFVEEFPHLYRQLAWAILFIPSVFFWGAAPLMKDTVVIFAMGYAFSGLFNLLIRRRKIISSIIYLIVGSYFCIVMKPYIIMAMLPPLAFWVMSIYQKRIKSTILRRLFKPFFLVVGGVAGFFLLSKLAATVGGRLGSVNEILSYAKSFQVYSKQRTEKYQGSGYELGDWQPTPQGVLPLIPKAINVTLFRPYFWEAGKIINLPSCLEAMLTFFITVFVFFRVGFARSLLLIYRDPYIMFCMFFALVFAFAVGFTAFNFGTLARYKIPCLPFYFVGLALLYDYRKKKKEEIDAENAFRARHFLPKFVQR